MYSVASQVAWRPHLNWSSWEEHQSAAALKGFQSEALVRQKAK